MTTMLRAIIDKNLKTWEDCLPFIEFAYNRVVHSTTKCTPFEIVYGFNPLTPIDLLPLPPKEFVNFDADAKVEFVHKLHKQVKERIEKQNSKVGSRINKGRKIVIFKPGDWVWVHFRKERFPTRRKSKLLPRGDGPFQVLERINDNVYKIDLPGEYGVSATFNVVDLSPFDVDDGWDSRANPSQEGENDMNQGQEVVLPQGPITRMRAKKLQLIIINYIQAMLSSSIEVVEDVEVLPYMLCKVKLEDGDALNAF